MNWGLVFTVFGVAVAILIVSPLYLALMISYQKSKFEAMVDSMAKADKKMKDIHFDEALKTMFEEGVEND
jgi:hypothetical protein